MDFFVRRIPSSRPGKLADMSVQENAILTIHMHSSSHRRNDDTLRGELHVRSERTGRFGRICASWYVILEVVFDECRPEEVLWGLCIIGRPHSRERKIIPGPGWHGGFLCCLGRREEQRKRGSPPEGTRKGSKGSPWPRFGKELRHHRAREIGRRRHIP